MTELGDDFRAMREHRKMVSQKYRDRRTPQILELDHEGFDVEEITPYQFRINDRLDIFPTNARWHDTEINKRGSFSGQNVKQFVRTYFEEHPE